MDGFYRGDFLGHRPENYIKSELFYLWQRDCTFLAFVRSLCLCFFAASFILLNRHMGHCILFPEICSWVSGKRVICTLRFERYWSAQIRASSCGGGGGQPEFRGGARGGGPLLKFEVVVQEGVRKV